MIIPYTYEINGNDRKIFTFEVVGRGELKLIQFERYKRVFKSIYDTRGTWVRQKAEKLRNVEIPKHICDVIRKKMEEE